MAFDGYGTFIRLRSWVVDATNSVKIRADFHDDEDNNFADGLSHCITKDGQTTITQNIPLNSRRIVSLADPVDPQDAATKDYADTKLSKDGGGTITGDVTITGGLTTTGDVTVGGTVSATGYKTRQGTAGPYGGNFFNFDWTGGAVNAWIDTTNIGALATQAFANTAAVTAASYKLPIVGGTITGSLAVNGELVAVQNYVRFGDSGSPYYLGYLGGNYTAGGNTIWHSGNFNPAAASSGNVSSVRLQMAGDIGTTNAGGAGTVYEPFAGAVMTGWSWVMGGAATAVIWTMRFRYLQVYTTSWFTVGYAP